MTIIDAIILGIVQGLTEFLPVSSSGHLEIFKALLGADSLPQESMLFTVVVHFATALATMVVFRDEIAQIIKGLFAFKWNEEAQFSVKIIISMIPAAVIGVLFDEQLEAFFNGQILLVGYMLLITAGLLYFADKAKDTAKNVSFKPAFLIGLAQAIAMMPGISRSGATISTSVLLKIDRSRAARFSFLMVVPLIFGKIAKDLLSGSVTIASSNGVLLAAGFFAAFFSGIIACKWMISLVKKAKLTTFAIYCLIAGLLAIVSQLAFNL